MKGWWTDVSNLKSHPTSADHLWDNQLNLPNISDPYVTAVQSDTTSQVCNDTLSVLSTDESILKSLIDDKAIVSQFWKQKCNVLIVWQILSLFRTPGFLIVQYQPRSKISGLMVSPPVLEKKHMASRQFKSKVSCYPTQSCQKFSKSRPFSESYALVYLLKLSILSL